MYNEDTYLPEDFMRYFNDEVELLHLRTAIVMKTISINAVDKLSGNNLLYFAVLKIENLAEFQKFVDFFRTNQGDMNHVNNEGRSALDGFTMVDVNGNEDPRLNYLISQGAKYGRELSNDQQQLSAEEVIPGFDPLQHDGLNGAPTKGFSREEMKLRSVEGDIESPPESNTQYPETVAINDFLDQHKSAVGRLYDINNNLLGTAFLIKDNWIMLARHSVNYYALEDLCVVFSSFDGGKHISISGVVESGAQYGLDYLILALEKPIPQEAINPLPLSEDNRSSSLLFMGYRCDEPDVLRYASFSNVNPGQLAIVGYQQTGTGLSGSPVMTLSGEVCGLHLRASVHQKTGLYIKHILDVRRSYSKPSVIEDLIALNDVSDVITHAKLELFQEFVGLVEAFGEFDEGKSLKITAVLNANGVPVFSFEDRPENQNGKGVQNKIRGRLKKLKDSGEDLTEVQKKFIDPTFSGLKNENINICHNVAINAMIRAVVNKLNNPLSTSAEKQAELKAAEDFANDIASSDDEIQPGDSNRVKDNKGIKKKLPDFVKKTREKQAKNSGQMSQDDADELANEAMDFLRLANCRSKNLMPGYARVNQSVGNNRDPHLVKNGAGYKETDASKAIAKSAHAFFGFDHKPKKDGDKIQSSSIDSKNDIKDSYCRL